MALELKSMGLICHLQLSSQIQGTRPKTQVNPSIALRVLDQTLLPLSETWIDVRSSFEMIGLIQRLAVRGAPLIGVAAALALLKDASEETLTPSEFKRRAALLREARPTAVNLAWAMDRMVAENPEAHFSGIERTAIRIFEEDRLMCEKLADYGSSLIAPGDGVLTVCNSGGLATVGRGTALGVIHRAFEQFGKDSGFHVYACETRPLLQGARLTAWELTKLGVPYTLICDSMAASLMRAGKIQKCLVGADRIALNGDFANKVGTYSLAVLCAYHKIPFYTVAPYSTLDLKCPSGQSIPIEERSPSEVVGFRQGRQEVSWGLHGERVYNPSFDVTPVELLSGLVLDSGFYTPAKFQGEFRNEVDSR